MSPTAPSPLVGAEVDWYIFLAVPPLLDAFVIDNAPVDTAEGVTDIAPVEAPVAEVVPNTNPVALSSHPINTLLSLPLSITIPASFEGLPVVPFPNSINESVIVVLVELTVEVVPLTVKFPLSTMSANVTLLEVATACPMDIAPPLNPTPVPALS